MDDTTDRILRFVADIGIAVREGPFGADGFMPGMTARRGMLLIDRATLRWPGDLLHEAGHIAVTDPVLRPVADTVSADPGEEMAAICWSNAAARAIGLDRRIVFHDHGYKGGGQWLADAFENGSAIGLPMLVWYGMTTAETYPVMRRWLR